MVVSAKAAEAIRDAVPRPVDSRAVPVRKQPTPCSEGTPWWRIAARGGDLGGAACGYQCREHSDQHAHRGRRDRNADREDQARVSEVHTDGGHEAGQQNGEAETGRLAQGGAQDPQGHRFQQQRVGNLPVAGANGTQQPVLTGPLGNQHGEGVDDQEAADQERDTCEAQQGIREEAEQRVEVGGVLSALLGCREHRVAGAEVARDLLLEAVNVAGSVGMDLDRGEPRGAQQGPLSGGGLQQGEGGTGADRGEAGDARNGEVVGARLGDHAQPITDPHPGVVGGVGVQQDLAAAGRGTPGGQGEPASGRGGPGADRDRRAVARSDLLVIGRVHQPRVADPDVPHRGPHSGQRGDPAGGPCREGPGGAVSRSARRLVAVLGKPHGQVGGGGGEEPVERARRGAREHERADDECHRQHNGRQGERHPSIVGEDVPQGDPQQHHDVLIGSLALCPSEKNGC